MHIDDDADELYSEALLDLELELKNLGFIVKRVKEGYVEYTVSNNSGLELFTMDAGRTRAWLDGYLYKEN